MKNNQCPNCGSTRIYISQNGGGIGDGYQINVHSSQYDSQMMVPTLEWQTHLCVECGYFENYLLDKEMLEKIASNPEANGWRKAQ